MIAQVFGLLMGITVLITLPNLLSLKNFPFFDELLLYLFISVLEISVQKIQNTDV